MIPSKKAAHIKEYYFSTKLREIRSMEARGVRVINLGIGSPDLAPHPDVISELADSLHTEKSFAYQPYAGIPELKNELLSWYNRTYDLELDKEITSVPLLGSKEGLHFLALAYLNPGEKALIPNPGYPAYQSAIGLAGGEPVSYTLSAKNGWHPDLNELEELADEHNKLLFINYPHMPTGQPADKTKLTELVQWCKKKNILLCNDNPYSQVLAPSPFSIFQLEGAVQSCIELNSLSKSASLSGARVGFMTGREELIHPVFKIQTSFSSGMFKPVQLAAIKALHRGAEYTSNTNQIYSERRKLIWQLLEMLGCSFNQDSHGLFVWARYPNQNTDSYTFSDELLNNQHIFLTPGELFGSQGAGYIRASLCQPENVIKEAITRIKN